MNENKIKEILDDQWLVNSLVELETPEEVQAALKAKGFELTIADIEKLGALMAQTVKGKALDDDELMMASGGYNWYTRSTRTTRRRRTCGRVVTDTDTDIYTQRANAREWGSGSSTSTSTTYDEDAALANAADDLDVPDSSVFIKSITPLSDGGSSSSTTTTSDGDKVDEASATSDAMSSLSDSE